MTLSLKFQDQESFSVTVTHSLPQVLTTTWADHVFTCFNNQCQKFFGCIDVSDGSWRSFVLVTSFRCQRTICDVGDRSTQRKNQHNVTNYHHNVTNITISKIFRIEPFWKLRVVEFATSKATHRFGMPSWYIPSQSSASAEKIAV